MSALGAHSRIDDAVDERGLLRSERCSEGGAHFIGGGDVIGHAAKGLNHLVVTRIGGERGGRWVGPTTEVGVVSTVDATIVQHHDGDGQVIAADGLHLHATEAEGTVALDGYHLFVTGDSSSDGIAHADAHDAPSTRIESQARVIHADDVARVVKGVGALVHDVDVAVILHHITHRLEGVEVVHGRCGGGELGLHLHGVGLLHGVDSLAPLLGALDGKVVHLGNQHIERRLDVAHHGCCDRTVAVDLLGLDIKLDKLHGGIPFLTLAMGEQPVEAGTDEHHHIGLTEHEATR